MAKALPQTYEPTNPPTEFKDWHRWIDDELNRIRNAIAANPVIMAVTGGDTIPIDTVPSTVTLGIGDSPSVDVPEGSWDPITGFYTVSLAGLYTVTVQAFIAAFGPGNKTYQANLEVFVNDVSRSVQISGGADDVPLALNLNATLVLLSEDVLRVDLTTLHEQFTGSSDYVYSMSIHRQAST